MDAPACIKPISRAQSRTFLSGGGTSPAAMRWANPSTTAVLPTPASPVRIGIVLPPSHQDVDQLAYFVVAAENGIHLARFGLRGEVLREAVERGRAFGPGGLIGARRAGRAQSRTVHRAQVLFLGSRPDGAMLGRQRVDIDLGEFLRKVVERATDIVRFQPGHQHVAGADLGFAEKQRRVVPAAIEHIDHRVGDAGHIGLVLAKAVDDAGEVGHQPRPIDLVVVGREAEVGPFLLQDMKQPMRKFDIAVARALGVSQGPG